MTIQLSPELEKMFNTVFANKTAEELDKIKHSRIDHSVVTRTPKRYNIEIYEKEGNNRV